MNLAARRNILFHARLRRGNFFEQPQRERHSRSLFCVPPGRRTQARGGKSRAKIRQKHKRGGVFATFFV